MSILIDTDVLIQYLRNDEPVVHRFLTVYKKEKRLCYSPVTRAEIVAGLRRGEEDITVKLFGLMECLKIDDAIGHKAGEYMKAFKASHNVELADAFIAATARLNDMPLWTLNRKHYPMKDVDYASW